MFVMPMISMIMMMIMMMMILMMAMVMMMMMMVMSISKKDSVAAGSSQGIGGPSVTSHDGVIVGPPASPPRSDHHDNVMVVCR